MAEVTIPDFLTGVRRRTRTYDLGADNAAEVFQALVDLITPAGTFIPTALTTEPDGDGWKMCNGQALTKTAYPRLYAIFGGTYGETSLTFNLPDLSGRTVMGAKIGLGLLALAGSADVTLTEAQLPPHTHGVTDPGHVHTVTDPGHSHSAAEAAPSNNAASGGGQTSALSGSTGSATTGLSVDSATTGIGIGSTGSGDPVDITPPVVGVNWLVRT